MSDPAEDKLRNKVLSEIRDDLELLGAVVADATVIADKRGFEATGWEALYLLFAERFAWSPEKVRSLTIQELSWMLDTFFLADPDCASACQNFSLPEGKSRPPHT